jgi:8-oxo-dGTP diphosphatase
MMPLVGMSRTNQIKEKEVIFPFKRKEENMTDYQCPGTTADIIDENEVGILLVQRKNDPFKGMWALPGGFLNYGKETVEEAAARELCEETHLSARVEDLVLIGVYSDPKRDPRGHVISHAYWVRKSEGMARADDDAAEARRFPRHALPALAFDHARILHDYFAFRRKYEDSK